MEEKLAYKCMVPHIKTMRACGLYRIDPKHKVAYQMLHRIYMLISVSFLTMYLIQQSIHIYQARDDAVEVMNAMFLLLTITDTIYKQIVIWVKEDGIEELLNILKGEMFNQGNPVHNDILFRRYRSSYVFLRIFNLMTLSTCFLWAVIPTIIHLQGKSYVFSIWLPFATEENLQFYVAVLYGYIQTSRQGFINSTMDCFITLFLAQCKTQITILRYDLENIVMKSKEEAISSPSSFLKILKKRLRKIILHYDEIVKLATKCQDVFGGAVMYQFLISGWILCTSVYRMVNLNPVSLEFISMVSYISCISTELFIFCYYGNELTYESIKLTDSTYAMDWLATPLSEQRTLLIFMERIKRPIEPMAGVILPLSASTFVSILRSSYSFYAFLKNSN